MLKLVEAGGTIPTLRPPRRLHADKVVPVAGPQTQVSVTDKEEKIVVPLDQSMPKRQRSKAWTQEEDEQLASLAVSNGQDWFIFGCVY